MERRTIGVYVEPTSMSRASASSALKEFDLDAFARELAGFVGSIDTVLAHGAAAVNAMDLKEVEISAKVGAEGKLGLLGSGVSTSGEAAIKFRFEIKKTGRS